MSSLFMQELLRLISFFLIFVTKNQIVLTPRNLSLPGFAVEHGKRF